MKIRWTSHPSKPELNGTEQHVAREFAIVACGYGQAEYCPKTRCGFEGESAVKIRWTSHPSKPELNGTEQHVAQEFAIVAVGYGQATLWQKPGYGTPEWAAERAALDARRRVPPSEVVPSIDGIRWELMVGSATGRPIILRRSGCETTRFEDEEQLVRHGAPVKVLKAFIDAKRASDPAAREAANEAAQQARFRQESAEKHAESCVLGRLGIRTPR